MTLAEVAERIRSLDRDSNKIITANYALARLESDPDFMLRARIEKLAEEFSDHPTAVIIERTVARRLREALEGK